MQYSPLVNAVRNYNLALCRQLVLHGADVNEQVTLGTTALHMACMIPAEEGIMEFLLTNNANPEIENVQEATPLMIACRTGSLANAALLLKYGANINHADSKGNTALFNAVMYGNSISTVRFLCSNGANTNHVNGAGETPLLLVCRQGNVRTASILLEHSANKNYVTTDGQLNSPILLSIVVNAPHLMRLLLSYGADVLHENSSGENAFFLACRLNHASLLHILCTEAANLDTNMRQNDERGYTALHVAGQHNSLDTARVLLDLQCDLWTKSKATSTEYPVTAYEVAQMHNHEAMANLIDSYLNPPTTRLY